jgi:hypothetical protein
VAAATYFVEVVRADLPVGSCLVVYDFGAGTFDASVVRRTDGGFDVLSAEGLPDAGGLDVDETILAYLGAVYGGQHPDLWQRLEQPTSAFDRRARQLLWEDVRTAKEVLSRGSATYVHMPLVEEDAPLGREQVERLARPVVDRTVAATRAAIRLAGIEEDSVAGVFLVGGSSRLPLAATLLHRALGIAPTVIEQPELVVAEGSLRGASTRVEIAAPVVAAPIPAAVGRARPVVVAPAPVSPAPFVAPAPVSPAPQPVSAAPQPVSAAPQPVSAAPEPVSQPPEPPAAPPHEAAPPTEDPPQPAIWGPVLIGVLAIGAFAMVMWLKSDSAAGRFLSLGWDTVTSTALPVLVPAYVLWTALYVSRQPGGIRSASTVAAKAVLHVFAMAVAFVTVANLVRKLQGDSPTSHAIMPVFVVALGVGLAVRAASTEPAERPRPRTRKGWTLLALAIGAAAALAALVGLQGNAYYDTKGILDDVRFNDYGAYYYVPYVVGVGALAAISVTVGAVAGAVMRRAITTRARRLTIALGVLIAVGGLALTV